MFSYLKEKLSYAQIIALGFFTVILIGAFLLMLPVSSNGGVWTPFLDSIFTATSATCVTGLIVYDTSEYWSVFGQAVILVLIQIGGLGFMSIVTMTAVLIGKTIHLYSRKVLMQSSGGMQVGGIIMFLKKIIFGTLIFEAIGAIVLAVRFCSGFGIKRGLWYAVFHSVSAFCNAGFDIMPGEFSSLISYRSDWIVNIVIMALIIIGGLGFAVWNDIIKNRHRFSAYSLHAKIALFVTALLIVSGTVLFYLFEKNGVLAEMELGEAWLVSAFSAVSPRTAGFNTIDLSALSAASALLVMLLMFIGANPGSTAGGIKTTTFWVLILSAISTVKGKKDGEMFKRRIDEDVVRQALAILIIYLFAVFAGTGIICAIQGFGLTEALFETISATATVGLSMGITPELNSISKLVIIVLMFGGRLGGLTLGMVIAGKGRNSSLEHPKEKILVG